MHLPAKLYAALTAHQGERLNLRLESVKRFLFRGVSGTVLEIGPGAGANLHFLPSHIRYLGVEPNDHLRQECERSICTLGLENATCIGGSAAYLSLCADDEVDVAISTFVLCTVPDPGGVLAEIHRVLKPGGSLIFIEHVAAERGTLRHLLQRIFTPCSRVLACGCELNRETLALMRASGFDPVLLAPSPSIGWRPLGPLIAGSAFKR